MSDFFIIVENGHYFQSFEGVKENEEYGTRKSSVRPLCGRQSLNIDGSWVYLYKADLSKKNGKLQKLFTLRTYNKVRVMILIIKLQYITLSYTMIYYITFYHIILHYIISYYITLYYIMLYYVISIYYIILYYIVVYYIILHCVMLYYVILYYVILYHIVLHCII